MLQDYKFVSPHRSSIGARNGRKVGWLLILSTMGISVVVILLMQLNGQVFPAYVLGYTLILSSTYIFSFLDLLLRMMTCSSCDNEDPLIQELPEEDDASVSTDVYVSDTGTCAMADFEKKARMFENMSKTSSNSSHKTGSDQGSSTDGSEDSYQRMADDMEIIVPDENGDKSGKSKVLSSLRGKLPKFASRKSKKQQNEESLI